jgi:putative peptidoglycan binding protein
MVERITRQEFTNLSRNGGYVDVDRMSPDLRRTFHDNGITDDDLLRIAGQDRVIRGTDEFRCLFDRIDELDRDGSSRTIATRDRHGSPTTSGRVFEALRAEVEANRDRARREGGARFAGDRLLGRVYAGTATLHRGLEACEGTRRVQQALLDLGALSPDHPANGAYDEDTRAAVMRFQREAGLVVDGLVGQETLSALASSAPSPGHRLERSAEYDRLYADGRLDVTIAVGFSEDGTHEDEARQILSGLRDQGFHVLNPGRMSVDERARCGLTPDRYDPNARYFARTFRDPRTHQDVTAVVRFITPGNDGARARASFEQALQQDEVVMYNGHARYGTGPDFDDIGSGRGNFVIDPHGNRSHETPPTGLRSSIRGRGSDLEQLSRRPDYQLLIFDACNTEEYLHNLRDPSVFSGRSMVNTDIITTAHESIRPFASPAVRFLQGLTCRESNNSMIAGQVEIERAQIRAWGSNPDDLRDAGHTFVESGFLGNADNRVVPVDRPR